MGKILQRSLLERCVYQTPIEKVDRFHTILAIAHITSLDADLANHRVQNRRLEEGARRQANGYHRPTRADILGGLLERLFVGC